jgi:glycosyltransferase involved in cell wall biosynthesis
VQTFIFVILIAYIAGVVSLAWSVFQTARLLRGQRAPAVVLQEQKNWPSLDVLVPVKDEAHNIADCLRTVLGQRYPNIRIIVVNDRSTDGTAQTVQAMQDQHANLDRYDVTDLPAGLYGKPHALYCVADRLHGEFIAFVDSDLALRDDCLAALVQHLVKENLDWVAVMGEPQVSKFWECLLVPQLGAISFAWYDPRKISDPRWPNAIGSALMVCRKSAYDAIGGHGCVIRSYDEDSEIIRIAKRAGQRVSFLLTPELFRQRHYGTLERTVRGVTRTFIGGIKTVPRLLFTMFALNFISIVPLAVLAGFGIPTLMGVRIPHANAWLMAGGAHLTLSTLLALMVYRTAGTSRLYALLHPLGAVMMIAICVRATLQLIRGTPITWRGTTY